MKQSKKTKRLTRNQKIVIAFKNGDNVDQLAADYRMTWDKIEEVIRRHLRNQEPLR